MATNTLDMYYRQGPLKTTRKNEKSAGSSYFWAELHFNFFYALNKPLPALSGCYVSSKHSNDNLFQIHQM